MKSISVIITYRSDGGGWRDLHYKFIKKWYAKILPEAEVIIEQQKEDYGIKYYRSKMINSGVKKAEGEVLFITDIDMLIQRETILKSVDQLDGKIPMVYPFGCVYFTSPEQCREILRTGRVTFGTYEKCSIYKSRKDIIVQDFRPAGINILYRDDFIKYGGYDERYQYWGSEDGSFKKKMETMFGEKVLRMRAPSVHLYHEKTPNRMKTNVEKNGVYTEQYTKAYGDKKAMLEVIKSAGKVF